LLVAHVNHGIRSAEETGKDEQLVKSLCHDWGLAFASTNLNLGSQAREDLARTKRHEYLRKLLRESCYNKIITAHHKDDVVETMIINLLRGTGRKGLSSLKNDETYLRPLIAASKDDVRTYAAEQKLHWNEDATNTDQTILRNYIRLTLMPKMLKDNPSSRDDFYQIYQDMLRINAGVDKELQTLDEALQTSDNIYDRQKIIMLPIEVSFSFLHNILTSLEVEVDSKMLKLVRNFIHTAKPSKTMNVANELNVICQVRSVAFEIVRN
jgi:tRNA(Ile)-lysidine synthase